ncbi:pentapeptide repeat-containing protein [Burkholderia pseudomallei]|uniref:pentapeptide repeat-containing protein n=2 Tax=Burkholderia pseudomallei TaxID=28450 RepID=UPI000A1A09C0|nr:pentapeptide repeat-containing protein [Burkholderia pseudomallei]ARK55364.1 hypothetical protein BOC36_05400 [Burkholderia pseudomallei]ARK65184.1 hypothetical protein BOC37_28600 [Burkholderia pseudomallei]ARL04092.1 hypothetical protein BOC44_13280 [Burkholderia pseudomallei]ARL11170.1 hypothetical protein BOC45_15600 [Burkholderia pseudomallei]ARL17757.1 hypothetical protein BOC46_03820 [Burkholderia pseudomallei]
MTDIIDGDVADYYQKEFSGLKFPNVFLSSKVFEECEFSGCSFSGARFHGCKFVECTFRCSDLSNINVERSRFREVIFEECKIIGVDWSKAEWSRIAVSGQMIFKKSVVNDSSFFGLRLPELTMEECKVHAVDFRGGDFSESNFSYSDFAESMFGKTNLSGADFREAVNYGIDIRDNMLKGAKFTRYEAVRLLEGFGFELFD